MLDAPNTDTNCRIRRCWTHPEETSKAGGFEGGQFSRHGVTNKKRRNDKKHKRHSENLERGKTGRGSSLVALRSSLFPPPSLCPHSRPLVPTSSPPTALKRGSRSQPPRWGIFLPTWHLLRGAGSFGRYRAAHGGHPLLERAESGSPLLSPARQPNIETRWRTLFLLSTSCRTSSARLARRRSISHRSSLSGRRARARAASSRTS